jgi:hypothetical protein
MSDDEHVYLPKLFGGPAHGRRMAFADPLAPYQSVVCLSRGVTHAYVPESAPKPVTHMPFNDRRYLRHDMKIGRRWVHAFVIEGKRPEEAFEMVCNYLLRTALPCQR